VTSQQWFRGSIFLLLVALGPGALARAEGSPLNLGSEDSARLDRGEAVIHEVKDPSALSLSAAGSFADELRARVSSLRPNYLSEVIFSAPRRKGAMEALTAALADVKGYVGIKYWSLRNHVYFILFDKMEIKARSQIDGGERIETWQHMEPFSDYGCIYTYRMAPASSGDGAELFFMCENSSSLSFDGVNAVSPGRMLWILYAFPEGDRILFYGVGAVQAFDMFGMMRSRLETSFIGRVESFFNYMSGKLRG
jgi:hypothetical protein